jgi:hypothetical protein
MSASDSIIDYAWNILRQENGWTKINGKIPALPTNEQPEFDSQDQPYFLYADSRETGRGDLSPLRMGAINLLIFSKKGTRVVDQALDTLENAFDRLDESALDINKSAYHPGNPRRSVFLDTHLTWTQVTNTLSAKPADSEGGKAQGLIVVRYQFTVNERPYTVSF